MATPAKTNTTKAIPPIVRAEVRRRANRFLIEYFKGIFIFYPTFLKPSTIDVLIVRYIGRSEARKPTIRVKNNDRIIVMGATKTEDKKEAIILPIKPTMG